MPSRSLAVIPLLSVGLLIVSNRASAQTVPSLESQFETRVLPFLKAWCLDCHGHERPKARLDLSRFRSTGAVVEGFGVWDHVLERLEADEMPPEEAPRRPTAEERLDVIAWIQGVRDRESRRNAGDPGPVLARRLSNAELDHTIRDLTGVDIRPTREFPVDPANEAGFDNSGESLTMSPALLKKYLAAARRVADHLVLKPYGFSFAPHPVVTDTDRDKYCVQRIVGFYRRHRVDYADYLMAAWDYQHRDARGDSRKRLDEFARSAGLSPRYLGSIWSALSRDWPNAGPLGQIQARWRKLPSDPKSIEGVRRECEEIRELILSLRRTYEPAVGRLKVKGISAGSQPLVLWRNRQVASLRMSTTGEDRPPDVAEFCRLFPDAFFIDDRPPYFDQKGKPSGRLLTAGFHLMQGYFRDDIPLCELVLDEQQSRELDDLWLELDFATMVPARQYRDFIFFEREEPPMFMQERAFDFARSEDRDAASPSKIEQLRVAYLAKARLKGAEPTALEAIDTYFTSILGSISRIEKARRDAEPSHLEALAAFAQRAFRHPLSSAERADLLAFYQALREKDGLSHEDALRDAVTSVLVSPDFCYRIDRPEPGREAKPLSDYELASRLSYFLWSSMPDEELIGHAAAGDLADPKVLRSQAHRMLRDGRVRGLATEFAGNWLGFRRFEEHNSVDRVRFASFTNELRQAMYEEPIRFFVDLVANDRSVLSMLDANHTFVNAVLAQHYGMPPPHPARDAWVRIDDAKRYGRGGLLPMSVFLTANSPGLRTSPVKRGYWVVRRLLGENIPPPPPNVPELPKDEAASSDLSLPQLLARHRDNPSCASCHQRFDTIGLVFEGYGPVGERRERDLGGRPVETRATFPDGTAGSGLDGLRHYLAQRRQDEFLDNFCRKLLAYALGRGLLPSDDSTVRQMRAELSHSGYRFASLVETIVASPQFLKKRGRDDPRE